MAYNPHTDIMNEVYLKQAYIHATHSIDPSTQNGAILIHQNKGILLGTVMDYREVYKINQKDWKDQTSIVLLNMQKEM